MPKDISNNVVAVLLVLIVVVAAFGTWAFLTEFDSIKEVSGASSTSADVQLKVGEQPSAPPSVAANVQLQIATAEE